uniref:Ig-like domain-containing protein n=1 Tax=Macrostomum lignano TaxID=282301 RepID=A0A1I8INH8_9PLAT
MDIFAYLKGNPSSGESASSQPQSQQQQQSQITRNQHRPLLRSETDASADQPPQWRRGSPQAGSNSSNGSSSASKTPAVRRAVSSLIDYSRRPVFTSFNNRQLAGLESSALRLGLSSVAATPLTEADQPPDDPCSSSGPLNYLHADEGFVRSPPPIHLDRIRRMTSRDRSFLRSPTSPVMASATVADRLSDGIGLRGRGDGYAGAGGGGSGDSNGDATDEVSQLRESIERMRQRQQRSSLTSSRLDGPSSQQQQQQQNNSSKSAAAPPPKPPRQPPRQPPHHPLSDRPVDPQHRPPPPRQQRLQPNSKENSAEKASSVDSLLDSLAFNSIQGALEKFSTVAEAETAFDEEDSQLQTANKGEVLRLLAARGGTGANNGAAQKSTKTEEATAKVAAGTSDSRAVKPEVKAAIPTTKPPIKTLFPRQLVLNQSQQPQKQFQVTGKFPATLPHLALTGDRRKAKQKDLRACLILPSQQQQLTQQQRLRVYRSEGIQNQLPQVQQPNPNPKKKSLILSVSDRLSLEVKIRRGLSRRHVQLCRSDGSPVDSTQFRVSVIGESLRIEKRQLAMDDMGNYRVQIDDGAGKSETVEFNIAPPQHDKLTVTQPLADATAQEGGQLQLECLVAGLCDKCSLQWRCPPQSYRYKSLTQRDAVNGDARVTLTVARLRRDDGGEYRLVVQHDAESCESAASVTVTDRSSASPTTTAGGGGAGSGGGGAASHAGLDEHRSSPHPQLLPNHHLAAMKSAANNSSTGAPKEVNKATLAPKFSSSAEIPAANKRTPIVRETGPETRKGSKPSAPASSATTVSASLSKVTDSHASLSSKTSVAGPAVQAVAKTAATESKVPAAAAPPVNAGSKRTVIVRETTTEKQDAAKETPKSSAPATTAAPIVATKTATSSEVSTAAPKKTEKPEEKLEAEKSEPAPAVTAAPTVSSVTFPRRSLPTLMEEPVKEAQLSKVARAAAEDENADKSDKSHPVCNKPQPTHSDHLLYQLEASKTASNQSPTRQPEFETPLPEILCADELQEIHLSVVATPNSSVSNGLVCHWLFEGKPIDSQNWDCEVAEAPDGTFCLVVDRARACYSGEYTAVLECPGAEVSTASCKCLVTVHEAQPMVGRHFPAQVRVRAGDSTATTVACQLNAASNVRTRVRKDGRLLSLDPSKFELDLNEDTHCCTLKLKGLTESDSGKYEIMFSNRTGRSASSLSIHVQPDESSDKANTAATIAEKKVETTVSKQLVDEAPVKLEFEKELTDQAANVGDKDLKLACCLRQPDKHSVALWFFNTNPISDKIPVGDDSLVQEFDGRTASLTIRQLAIEHAGLYACGVKNSVSQIVSKCHLSVKPLATVPVIAKRLENQRVKESGNIVLQAELAAIDRDCNVRWYQNDQDLCRISGLQMEFNGRIARLVIRDAYLNDSGRYKVVITNEAGVDRSECVVEVDEKPVPLPRIIRPLQSCSKRPGQPLTLSCELDSPPSKDCRVDWYFDDSLIDVDSSNLDIACHASSVSLTIGCLTEGDEGQYTVRIANKSGEASSQCAVTVEKKPQH